jgi:hypothetical protein
MIIGDPMPAAGHAHVLGHITLDELFRRAAVRRPEALALADAANRESFTDGAPWRLSYAEADRVVSAIAGRLRNMLPVDAVVGIQLPHTVENILSLLGVLRAGMIAAPLPMLWRRDDVVAALGRVGAKAFITCRRAGKFDHAQFATRVAAEVFSIRYVCGFGGNLPDGVVPLDDVFMAENRDPVPPLDRDGNAAAHLAIMTFEMGQHGPVPVARRHLELLAGGLGVLLEGGIGQDSAILSAMPAVSFAGVCLTLVPWLLSGGALVLHHAFDAERLAQQRLEHRCGTLVLPAPVVFGLEETSLLGQGMPATILAAWRAPEQFAASADWPQSDAALVDVPIFGEAGLVVARRGADGRPIALPLGPIVVPRGSESGVTVAELIVTESNTLALRGPMVPRHAFPPGIENSGQPHFAIGGDGAVDTGYACQVDAASNTVVVTAPPPGFVSVGGYRFPMAGLREKITRIDSAATLTAAPDPVMGQRFVGTASDPQAMRSALATMGLSPLVIGAFAMRFEASRKAAAVA